jgi:hypothetical protein
MYLLSYRGLYIKMEKKNLEETKSWNERKKIIMAIMYVMILRKKNI